MKRDQPDEVQMRLASPYVHGSSNASRPFATYPLASPAETTKRLSYLRPLTLDAVVSLVDPGVHTPT